MRATECEYVLALVGKLISLTFLLIVYLIFVLHYKNPKKKL